VQAQTSASALAKRRVLAAGLSAALQVLLWSFVLVALTGCDVRSTPAAPALIRTYFGPALAGEAPQTTMQQALIAFLDSAARSLDVAIHSLSDPQAIQALERACKRGVRVRVVVEVSGRSGLFDPLGAWPRRPCPQLRQRTGGTKATLMHHKFAVADVGSVWTGSANWTDSGFNRNANDALVLPSVGVAQRFEQAFERLFKDGRFGKTTLGLDPGPVVLGSSTVAVFFAPNDQLETELVRQLQRARSRVVLALFYYTNDRLHKALLDALARGVRVEALWERRGWRACELSEVDQMLALGVGQFMPLEGVLHHKFAVIDGHTVLTGSANWTASAFKRNDENLLVIEDEGVARRYLNRFAQLLAEAKRYTNATAGRVRLVSHHYNALPGSVRLEWRPLKWARGYEICRQAVRQGPCEATFSAPSGPRWFYVDRSARPGVRYYYRVRAHFERGWGSYSKTTGALVADAARPFTARELERGFKALVGQRLNVTFEVESVSGSRSGNAFIHADKLRDKDFTAFIPACVVSRLNARGVDLNALAGTRLTVSGTLRSYGGPEIVVYDAGQLRWDAP